MMLLLYSNFTDIPISAVRIIAMRSPVFGERQALQDRHPVHLVQLLHNLTVLGEASALMVHNQHVYHV